jgi:preprotein translocase subunit SecY
VILSNQWGVPFFFGGTALLIVVGVALDTIRPDRRTRVAAVRGGS